MKLGASFYSFAQDVDVREAMEHCKKAGYDGVEPVLSEAGYLNMSTTDAQVTAMRAMAEDMGLEIPSLGVWSLWDNNLVSADAKMREYAEAIISRQLEIAALLHADTILVVPGSVGNDFAAKKELVRYDIAYERAQEAIGRLAKKAEQLDVNIGIENVWNRFLLSPIEMRRFVDEIGSPRVGVYFDAGNIIYIGYPQHWIEILGSRIKKMHFCDYRASQAGLGAFVDLLSGDVDYTAVMAALKSIGYDDYVTLEILPNYSDFPYLPIYSNKCALDTIINL